MKSAFGFKKHGAAETKNESVMLKFSIPDIDERKVLKVNKTDSIGEVLARVVEKFDKLKEKDAYHVFLPAGAESNPSLNTKDGKFLKGAKSVGEYKLADNTALLVVKKPEPAPASSKKKDSVVEKRKGSSHHAKPALFGRSLAHGVTVNNPRGLPYPVFIEDALDYLEKNGMDTEGMFRLSGMASEINSYKDRLNKGEKVNFSEEHNPHNMAGLVKLYLRELAEPLMTYQLYDAFMTANHFSDPDMRVALIRGLVACLPATNRALLQRLCLFFSELATHSEVTRMHHENLATVFGPNILRRKEETAFDIVAGTAPINALAHTLIAQADTIFKSDEAQMIVGCARAEHGWQAQNEGEISFEPEDIIFVRNDSATDGWWEGWAPNEAYGLFPTEYVKMICTVHESERPNDANRSTEDILDEDSESVAFGRHSTLEHEPVADVDDKGVAELEALINGVQLRVEDGQSRVQELQREIESTNATAEQLREANTQLRSQLDELESSALKS